MPKKNASGRDDDSDRGERAVRARHARRRRARRGSPPSRAGRGDARARCPESANENAHRNPATRSRVRSRLRGAHRDLRPAHATTRVRGRPTGGRAAQRPPALPVVPAARRERPRTPTSSPPPRGSRLGPHGPPHDGREVHHRDLEHDEHEDRFPDGDGHGSASLTGAPHRDPSGLLTQAHNPAARVAELPYAAVLATSWETS